MRSLLALALLGMLTGCRVTTTTSDDAHPPPTTSEAETQETSESNAPEEEETKATPAPESTPLSREMKVSFNGKTITIAAGASVKVENRPDGGVAINYSAPNGEKDNVRLQDKKYKSYSFHIGNGINNRGNVVFNGNNIVVGDGGANLIVGEGPTVTETRPASDFKRLETSGAFEVEVRCGKAFGVSVAAQKNIQALIRTDVEGGTLTLRSKGTYQIDEPIRVTITCPTLDGLEMSGSGSVRVDSLKTPQLTGSLSGSGKLILSGDAKTMNLTLSGSGCLQGENLKVQRAAVDVSGSGRATLWVTRSLEASVSGSGSISYRGNPSKVNAHTSGAGTVSPL